MNTRTVGPIRCSAPARATLITAVSAWAFLSATACGEREPFDAKARVFHTVGSQGERPPEEVSVYAPPDLLAVPPPCLGKCG